MVRKKIIEIVLDTETTGLDYTKEKMVEFELPSYELAFWNIDMRKVVEPGKFKIMVGTDSQNGLETFFEVK